LVDPRLLGQAGWVGSAVEPFGVGVTGPVEGGLALGADVVAGAGGVVLVVRLENPSQKVRASARDPNRSGKAGTYFRVLNAASE